MDLPLWWTHRYSLFAWSFHPTGGRDLDAFCCARTVHANFLYRGIQRPAVYRQRQPIAFPHAPEQLPITGRGRLSPERSSSIATALFGHRAWRHAEAGGHDVLGAAGLRALLRGQEQQAGAPLTGGAGLRIQRDSSFVGTFLG